MNLIFILLVLLLLFGGGGFYFGGPVIGGSGIGLLLLICLIIFLMGGFRTKTLWNTRRIAIPADGGILKRTGKPLESSKAPSRNPSPPRSHNVNLPSSE